MESFYDAINNNFSGDMEGALYQEFFGE